jgi:hypothetical protein
MIEQAYRLKVIEQTNGSHQYEFNGPGLEYKHVYCGDDARQRLTDVLDLMNFAFAHGKRAAQEGNVSAQSPNTATMSEAPKAVVRRNT